MPAVAPAVARAKQIRKHHSPQSPSLRADVKMATGKGLARTGTSPSNNLSCLYLRPHLHMKLPILCLPKEPRKETKDERIPWSCFPTNIPPKRGNTVFAHVPRKSNPIIGKKSPCSEKEELNSFMLPRKISHVAGASWKKNSGFVLLAPISETI